MPPVYQQSMRGTCVANAATALVEYYEDCKARLSIQFLHEMTKTVERNWIDGNLDALAKGESVDPEFGARPVKRAIQRYLLNDLSKKLLSLEVDRSKPIIVERDSDGLKFRN